MKLELIPMLAIAAIIAAAFPAAGLFAQGDAAKEGFREQGGGMRGGMIAEMKKINELCQTDLAKFCKDIKPGEGRLLKCLEENKSALSDTCKTGLTAGREKRKKAMMKKNPCAADIEKFCKDIERGEGKIMKCLKEHDSELTDGCKAEEAKMKGRRKEMKEKQGERSGAAPVEQPQSAPEAE
jgi:hypothetical protein